MVCIKSVTLICLFLIFSLVLMLGSTSEYVSAQPQPSNEKISQGVREALSTDGAAQVVIALTQPPSMETQPIDLERLRREISELQDDVLSGLRADEYTPGHKYRVVPGLTGTIKTEQGLSKLAAHQNVVRIDLDVPTSVSLASTVPLIGADAWHRRGITGQGVSVAVLDTGLDTDHNDLSDDLLHEECFVSVGGGCPNGHNRQSGAGAAEDGNGHGTQVTGIITSRGTISSVGVAPDAAIVAIKILADNGEGVVSDWLAGLDFILADRPDVDVINMSLGTFELFSGNCDNATSYNMLTASIIDNLRANGIISFAASGNDGSGTQMSSPACISNVVSVGATDDSDNVADFTNSNTTLDIMAPGVNITSTGLANDTASADGTSLASPHAAGCAALLIEASVATTPDQIESRLETSKVQVTDAKNNLTFPRIDCRPAEEVEEVVLSVAAAAGGSIKPPQEEGDTITNGDFEIERTGNESTLGNGRDEDTRWSLDFTKFPNWQSFNADVDGRGLRSALLTLTLIPTDEFISTDTLKVGELPAIGANKAEGRESSFVYLPFQKVPLEIPSIIEIELLSFYTPEEVLSVVRGDPEGQVPMRFSDDAIVVFAHLKLIPRCTPGEVCSASSGELEPAVR